MRRILEEGAVTMKKTIFHLISLAILLIVMLLAGSESFALDAPHDATSSTPVGCVNCHPARGETPAWMTAPVIDDHTQMNNQCLSQCHTIGAGNLAPRYRDVQTHSKFQTSGTTTNGWVIECRVCHNPHYQKQAIAYPTEGYLVTGVVASSTISSLTVSTPLLTAGTLTNYLVVPDITYPNYLYRITGNTANTITVQSANGGGIATAFAAPGATFGIKLGRLMKESIVTPNSGTWPVKFYNEQGANSFATSSTTIDGICQVCHTQTTAFKNDGTMEAGGHSTGVAGTNCTDCHSHKEGFRGGGCDGCHGYPPLTASAGKGGLVNVPNATGTGATTPGAHGKHVTSLGMTCDSCHTNGMKNATYSNKIEIGFSGIGFSGTTGTYDGRASLANGYTYTNGNPATTVITTGGTMNCTLYCHSSGQGSTANNATPVYASPRPAWNGTAVCGSCHATSALATGSHASHLVTTVGATCGDCHTNATLTSYNSSNHVNQLIDVANNYSAAGNPGNGYGTCSTAACHASAYSAATITSPTWGGSASCGTCHPISADGSPATGSHASHMATTVNATCGSCHTNAVKNVAGGAGHLDGNIDVTAGYSIQNAPKHTAGSGYGTCSNASCHVSAYSPVSQNTPTWGSSATCGSCHPIATDGSPATGSHASHMVTTVGAVCGSCHPGSVKDVAGGSAHLDGNIDVTNGYPPNITKHAAGSGYATCNNASCHVSAYSTASQVTPTWGGTASCGTCHPISADGSPATGSHASHMVTTVGATCGSCHIGSVKDTAGGAGHLDGNIDVTNGYPQNRTKHAAGSGYATCNNASCHQNAYSTASQVTPTWGGSASCGTCHPVATDGAPATGSHASHMVTTVGATCGSCHIGSVKDTAGGTGHLDGNIDVRTGTRRT